MKSFKQCALAPLLLSVVCLGVTAWPETVQIASAASNDAQSQISTQGLGEVNAIRTFFFCQSATCTENQSQNATKSQTAMNALQHQALAVNVKSAPKKQRAILKKFVSDVTSLAQAYQAYGTQSLENDIARNTGRIYYESANVGSDVSVLKSTLAKSNVNFAQWSVGAVAVLYTMQIDTQTLEAKSSSSATDVAANNDLIEDSSALQSDAQGPSVTFNQLLTRLAADQVKVSSIENSVLEGAKTNVTKVTLDADISALSKTFEEVISLQKTLAK
jgi:hypothetical protein